MPKAGIVTYPKRRQKKTLAIEGVPEPERESLYDVMMRNFKLINRVTFIHRILYAGEHSLMRDQDILASAFSDIIEQVNEEYHLEKLSGFLLTYNKCFVHMLEGDEDSINKHLKLLFENKEIMKYIGTLKLIMCIHHINQRFQDGWSSYCGTPSKLFEDIDANSNLEETGRHIYNCIKKMYKLVNAYLGGTEGNSCIDVTPNSSLEETTNTANTYAPSRVASMAFSYASIRSVSQLLSGAPTIDPYRNTLPEYELVRFIINSNYTQTLQSYYALYRHVPQRDIYKDRVWPIPSDFVPYDVFSKPYDTVIELPRDRTEDHSTVQHSVAFESSKQKKQEDEIPAEN